MSRLKSLFLKLLERLKEPSSMGAIAIVAAYFGVTLGAPDCTSVDGICIGQQLWSYVMDVIVAVSALLAFVLKEGGKK